MKKDQKEIMKEITDKLETGVKDVFTSGRYEEYLNTMSKFYSYSANNCLLIMLQCPHATLVAGYRKWEKEFERHVKKGETAIRILAPWTHKKKVEDENGDESEITWMTFRPVPVFDYSQTEGKELPDICGRLTGDVDEDLLEKVKSISPVPVAFENIAGSAYGYFSRTEGRIVVKNDIARQHQLKTLIHEIAYATLHCKGAELEKADRNTKEVQAESVAYVVCQYLGIDTSDYSFGYVAAWSKDREVKELQANLELIRQTAGELIEQIRAA